MNALIDAGRFQDELAGWAVRGLLCAVPSAFWAMIGGFIQPNEIMAIMVGFAIYVMLFAAFCSAHAMQQTETRQRLVRALKMSAWLKASLLLGVVAAWGLALIPGFPPAGLALGLGVLPDMWLGFCATSAVGWLAGLPDVLQLGELNSFPWTLLTTLLQGAFVSVLLVALAGGILGCSRLWRWLGLRIRLSPVRLAG